MAPLSDQDPLVDDDNDLIGEDPAELTPREIKKLKFARALPRLEELAKNLHRLTKEDRASALQLFDAAEKTACELSLVKFLKCAWPHLDTSTYKHNWHFDIIAAEAEKIVSGESRRLIVNMPPRCGKSLLLTVVLPLWIWIQPDRGPLSGPQVKFLTASYGQSLSFEHSNLARKLILSPWFQNYWSKRVQLRDDRNSIGYFENNQGGYRYSTSVGAGMTGRGGDIAILDDPADTAAISSPADRQAVINWYTQSLSTRLNDPKTGAIILVMQRQHEEDLTGYILANEAEMWEHIVFRMRYETNPWLEYDPRNEEGDLLWPERMPEEEVEKLSKTLGSFGVAGQLQQRPTTKGGEIIRAKDWQLFPPKGQEEDWKKDGVVCWPPVEFVLASLDGAFSEKNINDASALTIWGIWHDRTGAPKVLTMRAWEDRLSFNPLVMRVGNNCRKFKVDVLLIEAKANGISVAQEIRRVFGASEWTTHLINPRGDKIARALSVQGMFEEELIYAPDTEWAQKLIDQCSSFPMGKHDDLVDSTTQALSWLRTNGLIRRKDERAIDVFNSFAQPGEIQMDLPYDV